MIKKVHVLFVSLLLACAVTLSFTSCSDLNSVYTTNQTESITITSRTTSSDQNKLELTVAFANFSTTPATVDVYLEGQESPLFSDAAVSDGKISIDISNLEEGTHRLYVKSGNISSNLISITLTKKSGIITISAGEAKGTEYAASAVIHFKQSIDGKTYELADIENKNAPAGSTLESLEKSYKGFTAQGIFLAEQTDGTFVVNLYYTRNIISVTLNGNGGTIGGQESTIIKGLYGADFPQSKDLDITHATKSFDCWNTEADGSGSDYKDTTGFTFTEDITLYAKWLDYYELTVAETAEKIESLGSGSYTIKVSGAITASDIEAIRDAMLINEKRYIALDLSKTTGLTKLEEEAFTKRITSIPKGAPLLSLVLPETVTEIGKNCFYNCYYMKSITARGVKVLNFGAFYVCKALTDIQLADELTSIGSLAFGYCNSLTELTVNAITINKEFISYSKNLAIINIGPSVKNLTGAAFQDNKALKIFTVDKDNTLFKVDDGILYSADGTNLVRCPPAIEKTEITLSDSVTSIDDYAFAYCKKLKTVSLPNVEIISSQAFEFATSLEEVSIPKATKIEGMTFYECNALSSITLPDTLTHIGMYAFHGDTKLSFIFIPSSVTTIYSDAFNLWTENQTINCEAESKPNGWDTNWNRYNWLNTTEPTKATINWGATRN